MYNNYERLKINRETVNNKINRYKLFGNSLHEMIAQNRRFRAIQCCKTLYKGDSLYLLFLFLGNSQTVKITTLFNILLEVSFVEIKNNFGDGKT